MSMDKSDAIDFVIIWVDGSDPAWQAEKRKYAQIWRDKTNDPIFDLWIDHPMRYRDWDNLQYWFRGVETFAPWVRKVHFVTWGHLPPWLNTNHPKLHIVNHRDFIPPEYLPTFQANPIEDNLHRIPGLAEQFVFFNDDMFLIRPTKATDFFKNGLPRDYAVLDMPRTDRYGTPNDVASAEIFASHFSKKEVIKKHWWKWFNICYFPNGLIKNVLLFSWRHFSVLQQHHLPAPMLKSTYEELWELEHDSLDKTCREKFRGKSQLNQYLFSDWQRVSGKFSPGYFNIGRRFDIGTYLLNLYQHDEYNEALDYIRRQKGKMVCLNDGDMSEKEFERKKRELQEVFQKILPERSTYEK